MIRMRINIKALLVSAAVSISCLFSAAFADEKGSAALFDATETANPADGRIITVKIKMAPQNDGYDTLYVLKSGDACDDGVITAEEAMDGIYFGESTNKGGEFEFKFRIKGSDSGVYTMIAGGNTPSGNLKSRNIKFWYNKDGLKSEKLSAFNSNMTTETLEAGNKDEWYIDTQSTAYSNNKAAVISIMTSVKPETGYKNQFDLEEAFNFACDVINSDDIDAAKIAAYAQYRNDRIGLDFTNTDYIAYSEDVFSRFKTVLDEKKSDKEIKNIDDVRTAFNEACAVVCIDKTTDHAKAIDNLKKYNDIFKIDFTTKLPYIDNYEVAKVFADTNYTTVSDIVSDYNKRVDELYTEYLKNKSGSGGGGSSSGGSGGGGYLYVPSVIDADDINQITGGNSGFPDVASSHWASGYIQFVKDNKIMQGDENGLFKPDDSITREEWVKTILTAFVIDTKDAKCDFSDVDEERWSYPYIAKAFEMMIINGVSDTEFAPAESISRQDAAVIFYRGAKAAREDGFSEIEMSSFTDAEDIADYAIEPINLLYKLKVLNGYEDGSFRPNAPITRAEAAKMIYTALEKLG